MRTTVDIPDDLLRRAKIMAVERGVNLKDVFAEGLERLLSNCEKPRGRHRPPPVRIEGVDWTFPFKTNAQLFESIEREEEES